MPENNINLIGTNAYGKIIGDSGGFDLVKIQANLNLKQLILSDDAVPMFTQTVSQLIEAFATNRGYPTTLTASNIISYFRSAAVTYAYFVKLWSLQNSSKLVDKFGRDISDVFSRRTRTTTPTQDLTGATVPPISDTVTISNAVWLRDYAGELINILLPSSISELIFGLFSGVFSMHRFSDAGISSFISLYPELDNVLSTKKTHELFDSNLATTKSILQSSSDMIPFLTFLGLSSSNIIEMEWSRDIHGKTVLIYEDSEFLNQLVNAKVLWPYDIGATAGYPASDNDYAGLFYDYSSEYSSVFDFPDIKEFNADDLYISVLFNRALVANPTLPQFQLNTRTVVMTDNGAITGSSPSYLYIPNVRFIFNEQPSEATANYLTQILGFTSLIGAPDSMVIAQMALSVNSTGVITGFGSYSVSTQTLDSFNTYNINLEDMQSVRQVLMARLWFGEDYRRAAQLAYTRLLRSRTNIE